MRADFTASTESIRDRLLSIASSTEERMVAMARCSPMSGGKTKGRIADRYREEPGRRRWDIAIVEYSVVPDAEQYEWEKFHLDAFAKEHDGRRPRHNSTSGRASR